jgi:hypothetical protein
MHTIFWFENLQGRDHSEDLTVDRRIFIRVIREIGWEDVDWLHLDQDRDQ